MSDATILSWVTFIYLLSALLYILRMARKESFWGRAATVVVAAGFTFQTVALMMRWKESYRLGIGHAPLSNFYESLIFFSWAIVLFYLLVEWRTKSKSAGAFVMPIVFLSMAYASFSPDMNNRIQPLIPALQSNWLVSHVITCFLGYAAFAVACGVGLMYLLKEREERDGKSSLFITSLFPEAEFLDELIYQSIVL